MSMNRQNKIAFRHKILKQQGWRCCYCRKRLELRAATFDHIVPRSLGGTWHPRNLCVACRNCNAKKANKPPHVWLNELAQGLVA